MDSNNSSKRVLLLYFTPEGEQIWSMHFDNAEADHDLKIELENGRKLAARFEIEITITDEQELYPEERF